jgi:CheY-like chemotaxis protein
LDRTAQAGQGDIMRVASVLLVEDDENDVMLIKRAFQKSHIINLIQVVTDGEAAISYLLGEGIYSDRTQYPFPVAVLLDLKLPRKSGLEFLSWAKQQPELKRLPIIVLTSSREACDIKDAYDLGVNSYLVKSFTSLELTETLKSFNMYWMVLNEPPQISQK